MKIILSLTLALACQISLSSCAPSLTSAQKAKMTAVSLQVQAGANPYSDPNFTSRKDAQTAGALSGAVGFGLVGALISEAYRAAEHSGDASRNSSYTQAIAKQPPHDLEKSFSTALQQQLKTSPFFGSRLSTQPATPARIEITTKNYRLSSLDDTLFEPVMYADVNVLLDNQSIRKKTYSTAAVPGRRGKAASDLLPSAKLADYAADPQMVQKHFEEAARTLARKIALDLDKIAGAP